MQAGKLNMAVFNRISGSAHLESFAVHRVDPRSVDFYTGIKRAARLKSKGARQPRLAPTRLAPTRGAKKFVPLSCAPSESWRPSQRPCLASQGRSCGR